MRCISVVRCPYLGHLELALRCKPTPERLHQSLLFNVLFLLQSSAWVVPLIGSGTGLGAAHQKSKNENRSACVSYTV
jgi:hypothetical protein